MCLLKWNIKRKKTFRRRHSQLISNSLVSTHAKLGRIHAIVILNIWLFILLFDYSFSLFDDRVKYSKFLLAVEIWFPFFKIIFVTPNKLLNITNNQMLISNIWIFRTNNGSNNQILISIILIIRPRLAFVASNILSSYVISHCTSDHCAIHWLIKFLFQEFFEICLRCYISSSAVW